MALGTFTLTSNRLYADVLLTGSTAEVAADAAINERYQLPPGFGDLELYFVEGIITTFSGAYVAPAPAYDGIRFAIIDQQNVSNVDALGSGRFVHGGGSTTLVVSIELYRRTILRQGEQLQINAPILAGAGVTVTVGPRVRGRRVNTG